MPMTALSRGRSVFTAQGCIKCIRLREVVSNRSHAKRRTSKFSYQKLRRQVSIHEGKTFYSLMPPAAVLVI